MSTNMNSIYDGELSVALRAVRLASLLTKSHLLKSLTSQQQQQQQQQTTSQHGVSASTKKDESEVTVADFAAQAVLIHTVHAAYPDDEFIAEESSEMLREDPSLCEKVYQLIQTLPLLADAEGMGVDVPLTEEQMTATIDLGKTTGPQGQRRRWILDPIDGTRTYMRGQQYAVCLSLVIDGQQQIGVLGCPNLKVEQTESKRVEVRETLVDHELMGGYFFSAIRGHGAYYSRMNSPYPTTPLHLQDHNTQAPAQSPTTNQLRILFTDSGASPHTTQSMHSQVFQRFGHARALDIWSMQLKYIVLSLGAADAMIRLPPDPDYHASVWDHAGGQLIFQESGGKLTDARARTFEIGLGRTLEQNWGVIATKSVDGVSAEEVHETVLDEVRRLI